MPFYPFGRPTGKKNGSILDATSEYSRPTHAQIIVTVLLVPKLPGIQKCNR